MTSLVQRAKMKFESRAVEDLVYAVESFTDLIPIYTNHQFPDGVFRWCVSLSGTIPINYKVFFKYFNLYLMLVFLRDQHITFL